MIQSLGGDASRCQSAMLASVELALRPVYSSALANTPLRQMRRLDRPMALRVIFPREDFLGEARELVREWWFLPLFLGLGPLARLIAKALCRYAGLRIAEWPILAVLCGLLTIAVVRIARRRSWTRGSWKLAAFAGAVSAVLVAGVGFLFSLL